MKLIFTAVAALLAATTAPAVAAAPAAAAPVAAAAPQDRVVVRERTVVRRDYRPRYRNRTVCRVTHRRGERRRVCRTVRGRY